MTEGLTKLQKNIIKVVGDEIKKTTKEIQKKQKEIKTTTKKNMNSIGGIGKKNTTRKRRREQDLIVRIHSGPEGLNVTPTTVSGLPAGDTQAVLDKSLKN
jgi:hypothetical protein